MKLSRCLKGPQLPQLMLALTSEILAPANHRISAGLAEGLFHDVTMLFCILPSGKHTKNYGKIHHVYPFLMGKSTISMAIFNSYANVYQRVSFFYMSLISQRCSTTSLIYFQPQCRFWPRFLKPRRRADSKHRTITQPHFPPFRSIIFWQDLDQDFLCLVTGFWTQGRQLQREKF